MIYGNMPISGENYRRLIKDVVCGKYGNLEVFIEELCFLYDEELGEPEFNDDFIHKMQFLSRLLIDNKEYDYAIDLLDVIPLLGTYEDKANEGEECVISYAIRKIEDEGILARFLETTRCSEISYCFFEFENPAEIAAKLKKYNTLKLIFEKELCVEKNGFDGFTPLQYAVLNRDYDLAKFLLEEMNFNPDLYDSIEMPPIAIAADINDFKMAHYLILKGADVSALDGEGRSAIFYCRSEKMLEIFKEKGAARDNVQIGLISRAAMDIKQKGYISFDLVDMLLNTEKPIIQNIKHNLAILAAKYGDTVSLKRFAPFLKEVRPEDIVFATFESYNLDDMSIKKDVTRLIELTDIIISAGVYFDSGDDGFLSPYRTLAMRPQLLLGESKEKVTRLLDNLKKLGYSLDKNDILGRNIFHEALEGANIPLIEYCLSNEMSYKELDNKFTSAVYSLLCDTPSCRQFKEENMLLVEGELIRLLDAGCDINHQNEFGDTPLHGLVNARVFRLYPIKLLLKYKADLSIKNRFGETPYDIAVRRNMRDDILEILKPRVRYNDLHNR